MDAGNMLKPMLARGELRLIGATTLDEYRQHIEKDPALERRFQPVLVGEPRSPRTPSRSCAGSRARTRRTTGSRSPTPRWSRRRSSPTATSPRASCRTRPSTSIDEAASRLRMEIDSRPVEIDELQRAVDRLKMEELALEREADDASRERLKRLRAELADSEEQLAVAERPVGAGEVRPEPGR